MGVEGMGAPHLAQMRTVEQADTGCSWSSKGMWLEWPEQERAAAAFGEGGGAGKSAVGARTVDKMGDWGAAAEAGVVLDVVDHLYAIRGAWFGG